MKIVLDTSVVAKWYLQEDGQTIARGLLADILAGKVQAHSSELLCYEVLGALTNKLDHLSDVQSCLEHLEALLAEGVIQLHPVAWPNLHHAARLADLDTKSQGHVSSYDAVFHALALDLDATLITADAAHFRKTKEAYGAIMLLKDYAA